MIALWVMVGIVALIGLVAAMGVVGQFLPQTHVASRRVELGHPSEVVFARLADFAAGASWRRSIQSVAMLPPRDGKPSFREEGSRGALVFVVEELSPPSRLVTRIVDNPAFGGTWTYELTPSADGCTLEITERGEVYNPWFRFIGHFFISQTATIEAYLAALTQEMGGRLRALE